MKTSPTAEIWPVPADDPARQGARLNWLLACSVYWLVLLAPAVLVFVVICAGLWAVQILFMPGAWFKILAVGFGVPVIMGLAKFWIHPMNPFPACLADRLVRRRLRGAFARRANSVLQGRAGDAIPAVMRPRSTWSFLGAASQEVNRGLLLFDIDDRVILFEGERENYVIPIETILSGRVEVLRTGEVHQSSDHAVVIKVQLGEGVWELPFLPLAVKLHSNRWYRAKQLLVTFDLLCDRQWSDDTSPPPRTLDEAVK
jgi:hypothetical protein